MQASADAVRAAYLKQYPNLDLRVIENTAFSEWRIRFRGVGDGTLEVVLYRVFMSCDCHLGITTGSQTSWLRVPLAADGIVAHIKAAIPVAEDPTEGG